MYKSFLIKYAEIAIKGKNRYLFEDALVQNIRYHLEARRGKLSGAQGKRTYLCGYRRGIRL